MWLVFKWKLGFVYISPLQFGYKLNDALPCKYLQFLESRGTAFVLCCAKGFRSLNPSTPAVPACPSLSPRMLRQQLHERHPEQFGTKRQHMSKTLALQWACRVNFSPKQPRGDLDLA